MLNEIKPNGQQKLTPPPPKEYFARYCEEGSKKKFMPQGDYFY